jgi:serpin B
MEKTTNYSNNRGKKKNSHCGSGNILSGKPAKIRQLSEKSKSQSRFNTTIGDLICAIHDAAEEVSVNEKVINKLTQQILSDILKRKTKIILTIALFFFLTFIPTTQAITKTNLNIPKPERVKIKKISQEQTDTSSSVAANEEEKNVSIQEQPLEDFDITTVNNEFAIKLYQNLTKQEDTFVAATYSMMHHFAALYGGSKNETQKQMQDVLGLDKNLKSIGVRFKEVFSSVNNIFQESNDSYYRSNIWANDNNYIQKEYNDYLNDYFLLNFDKSDFFNDIDFTKKRINEWVLNKSDRQIQELFSKELKASTRMVIVDLFNLTLTFDKKFDSVEEIFTSPITGASRVDYIAGEDNYLYVANDDFQALELKQDGRDLSILFILPAAAKSIDDLENILSAELISSIEKSLTEQKLYIRVPTLKISSRINVKDKLTALGMSDIFTGKADLSGITGTTDLFLNPYIQQADLVTVNKRAANQNANAAKEVSFIAERPFIFAVMHKPTNVILMLGKFSN